MSQHPPGRGEARDPVRLNSYKRGPRPGSQPEPRTPRRQAATTRPTVTRMVPRIGRACDTLVNLSLDVAALARRTESAKHAEAAGHLLSAIGEVWQAGEALAESQEAIA